MVLRALDMLIHLAQQLTWLGGNLYDHLMCMQIFTLFINATYIQAPNSVRQMTTGTLWICSSSHTNFVFHILWEVGAERKTIHLRHIYLTITCCNPLLSGFRPPILSWLHVWRNLIYAGLTYWAYTKLCRTLGFNESWSGIIILWWWLWQCWSTGYDWISCPLDMTKAFSIASLNVWQFVSTLSKG